MWTFVRRVAIAAGITAVTAGVLEWRHRRLAGEAPFDRLRIVMNERVNPWLLSRGIAGGQHSEIGTIEHIGRRTGEVRRTPVHPSFVDDQVWIPVPYGEASQWARNVLAAGHCRLEFHDLVYDLDEPRLVPAAEDPLLPRIAARTAGWLGVEYLRLHRFGERRGALAPAATEGSAAPVEVPEPVAVEEPVSV